MANQNLYHVTKFSFNTCRLITIRYNYKEISKFMPVSSIKLFCFELFLSAQFLFWEFLNLNLVLAVWRLTREAFIESM